MSLDDAYDSHVKGDPTYKWKYSEGFNPHSPDCKLSVTENAQYAAKEETHMFLKNKNDPVNHPEHYTQYDGFEVIDITKQLDFLTGNAVKYILRADFKGNAKQDYEKAIWYLNKKLEEFK